MTDCYTPQENDTLDQLADRLLYDLGSEPEILALPKAMWRHLAETACYQIGYLIRQGAPVDIPHIGQLHRVRFPADEHPTAHPIEVRYAPVHELLEHAR